MKQRIAYAPESQLVLTQGIERLNRLLSLTLGPTRGKVAVTGTSTVDLLDDAAQLSKQTHSFTDALEDVGHQFLRSALVELYERTHDGIATCSVLTSAILKQTAPLLAFGHHPGSLQCDIRLAHEAARNWLRQRAWTIDTPHEIAAVIRTASLSSDVVEIVAEIVDSVGIDGAILVEETRQIGVAHEYIRGGRWSSGVASPSFLNQEPNQLTIKEPSILVTDKPITTVPDAIAVLEATSGSRSVLLIAPSFSDEVTALLLANRDNGGFESIIAVKAPHSVHSGSQQLDDIGLLTGGRFLSREHMHSFGSISRADFGRADRAWASRSAFGIIGGGGEVRVVTQRAAEVRAHARIETDPVRKAHLSARAGNLTGLSALIRVGTGVRGGPTKRQIDRAVAIARSALDTGVVDGGGAALARAGTFIACEFQGSANEVGGMALARALAAPMTKIIEHIGQEPGSVLNALSEHEGVFDVRTSRWVEVHESGLFDSLAVVEGALEVAVSTALMVLSTDVLVGRKAVR